MKNELYFCRNCKGLRNHKIIHEIKKKGSDEEGYYQWIDKFLTIECLGCETVSFLHVFGDTEMIRTDEFGEEDYYFDETLYPLSLKKKVELDYIYMIPESIRIIYQETISAFSSNSFILTGGGLRAIIEATCNHLKIKKGNLTDRIDSLHKKGYLTLSESNRLHSIRFLGNDALHEIEKPKEEHLYILLEIINHLLANLFINDKKLKGKLDTIIDSYEDYIRLIRNRINKDMIGKEISINEIIGKSKRLIPKNKYKELEEKLEASIDNDEIDYMSIIKAGATTIYKIDKVPEIFFDW